MGFVSVFGMCIELVLCKSRFLFVVFLLLEEENA